MSLLAYNSLPSPDGRFELGEVIGTGVFSKVYRALDSDNHGRTVAIKIQRYEKDLKTHINEEYRVLRDFSSHPNLPDFYGVYRKHGDIDEIWFVLEYCEGGSVIDIIRSLQTINRRVNEDQIAFILRETAKAILHLHENNIIHRDIRGSNILITREGEIKLCDFGLSRETKTTNGKRGTCIGSTSFMAPEIISCTKTGPYENRADVWAFGITAIELADGKDPFADMHPTRAMFQILRNPPPNLYRQSLWSQNFNDFISECLEKNPDHRPFLAELMEHPFFTELPTNDYYLSQELKILTKEVESVNFPSQNETLICNGMVRSHDSKTKKLFVEDLAALERMNDETILEEVKNRYKIGSTYSFIGDVLLSLNPNKSVPVHDKKTHNKYMFKSRSENAPHIFSVADSAYQDMLHHEEQQYILFSGESYSGKTTNMRLAFEHLIAMGDGNAGVANRIKNALHAVNALTHAGSLLNNDSTRCIMHTQMTFGTTGKVSGAIFSVFLLEKTRVSYTDMSQSNFHMFYYFYDAMVAEERLNDFNLGNSRQYRYLRIPEKQEMKNLEYVRDDMQANVAKFKDFETALLSLDVSQDTLDAIYRILAAILILGEVRYKDSSTDRKAALEDPEVATKVAKLLRIDDKKFQWALVNYCVIIQGSVEKRRMSSDEARDSRDVLAGTLYSRLVDYIINTINQKLAFNCAIFGDTNSIILLDLFGFECNPRNQIEQLFINSINEQFQYHYNQRVFNWEMMEQEEEHIPVIKLNFYDNRIAVDHLLKGPKGLFHVIDDASRGQYNFEFITDAIGNRNSPYVKRQSSHEFTVAHYTGKILYTARDIIEKNRDFLPPEMLETMRLSEESVVKICFSNPLSKSGNLTMAMNEGGSKRGKWAGALINEKSKNKRLNTLSHGHYSQIHKMRTLSGVFRANCLEMLKSISICSNSSGMHFVRCVRCDLEYREGGFSEDMVRQQLRAMAILDTARARQKGFSCRIPFAEFLRRYKFLAFDFEENVDVTKDNCRLLLIRLKMEGWVIGASKVFLKYYNEEFLARLYETQVKKIIKVQSMMRAFLAKRNIAAKIKAGFSKILSKPSVTFAKDLNPDDAVLKIQTAFRGYQTRKIVGPLMDKKTGKIDVATAKFIEPFAKRWKEKSIFQILLQYRSIRHMDLVNFSQQVHIYNQRMMAGLTGTERCIIMDKIDPKEINKEQLGPMRRAVWKIPFRLDEIPFFDTKFLCDFSQMTNFTQFEEDVEPWDAPMQRRKTVSSHINRNLFHVGQRRDSVYAAINDDDGIIVNELFQRDPMIPMRQIKPRKIEYLSPRQSLVPSEDDRTLLPRSYCSSPTPYSKSSVGNKLQKFGVDNENDIPVVYKKRTAPKPPSRNELTPPWVKKASAPGMPGSPARPDNSDPIRELELIGRKLSDETIDENDNPPFNFQGLLRKTKLTRNSMKRSTEGKLSLMSDDAFNNNLDAFVETSQSLSTVIYNSKHGEGPKANVGRNFSPEVRPLPRKKSLSNEMMKGKNGNADENDNLNFIKEEIAPGIIVEGYVADL